jgi:hypothetical protein
MIYLSWAVLYEGSTDEAYFEVLLPRVMEEIVMLRGVGHATVPPGPAVVLRRASVEAVAREACDARQAFHLVFIHADTGGRGLEAELDARSTAYCAAMETLCAWPPERCITITPRHETEAWILADPQAVTDALGYRGSAASIGLPVNAAQAELPVDPKAVLAEAVAQVRGPRRRPFDVKQIFAAIAQRQSLASRRQAPTFATFETALLAGLADLGSVRSA